MEKIDLAVYTSVAKVNKALGIILPGDFKDGKYHITERQDGSIKYLSVQQGDNYFRIVDIPKSPLKL